MKKSSSKDDTWLRDSLRKYALTSVWRRGRGVIYWLFRYYDNGVIGENGTALSPGWYKRGRKITYRLTIDHRFPEKTVYIGYKHKGRWINAESLYEPISVFTNGFFTINRIIATGKTRGRSNRRKMLSIKEADKALNKLRQKLYGERVARG